MRRLTVTAAAVNHQSLNFIFIYLQIEEIQPFTLAWHCLLLVQGVAAWGGVFTIW
jgi:hypothetical protein